MELKIIKLFEAVLRLKFCENEFDMQVFSIWNTRKVSGGYEVEVTDSVQDKKGLWSKSTVSKWVFISNEDVLKAIDYYMADYHRIGNEKE